MVQLQEFGNYEGAVGVVQTWMDQHPNDISQNDFLHLQIAFVYITEAYRRPAKRDESIRNATLQLEQALNIYAAKHPEDNDDTLYGIGDAYEVLGDISQKDKCEFFGKARTAFQGQLPLIKGDRIRPMGRPYLLNLFALTFGNTWLRSQRNPLGLAAVHPKLSCSTQRDGCEFAVSVF